MENECKARFINITLMFNIVFTHITAGVSPDWRFLAVFCAFVQFGKSILFYVALCKTVRQGLT
ncbi:hypothetical protein SAMN05720606_105146 [Paenibacillus polysaccharolyticus]|uniref:Uncharacterized protein n=1 Tax=Paenibacillus polysaccharolyticus TaxID=582692 RepID=A0A1G5G7J8_9BACL|nr:hypothetical protein SAMN05720606_105146 [Paenibacillus polysaccharolyticus]